MSKDFYTYCNKLEHNKDTLDSAINMLTFALNSIEDFGERMCHSSLVFMAGGIAKGVMSTSEFSYKTFGRLSTNDEIGKTLAAVFLKKIVDLNIEKFNLIEGRNGIIGRDFENHFIDPIKSKIKDYREYKKFLLLGQNPGEPEETDYKKIFLHYDELKSDVVKKPTKFDDEWAFTKSVDLEEKEESKIWLTKKMDIVKSHIEELNHVKVSLETRFTWYSDQVKEIEKYIEKVKRDRKNKRTKNE